MQFKKLISFNILKYCMTYRPSRSNIKESFVNNSYNLCILKVVKQDSKKENVVTIYS